MEKFDIVKNGYDKNQVDEYIFQLEGDCENRLREQKICIADLKREVSTLKQQVDEYQQKNSNVSDALVVAVETAKQIEKSSKNLYELEIKRVRSLYDKWKSFLDELMKKYPALQSKYDTKLLLKTFSDDIADILMQNKKSIEQKEAVAIQSASSFESNTVGLRMLINKMNSSRPVASNDNASLEKAEKPIFRNDRPSQETLAKYNAQKNSVEYSKQMEDKIKPISSMKLQKGDSFENLVDKFLTSDETPQENAYSKIMFEKQKNDNFNLKEAVTPTENLDEIMKSFSFYPENEKKKANK